MKDRTETNQKNFKLQTKPYNYTTKPSGKIIIFIFSKRPLKGEKIDHIENGKSISNDTVMSLMFFSLILSPKLTSLKSIFFFLNDMDSDSVFSVLKTFEDHPSINNIKSKKFNSTFSFKNTYTGLVTKITNNLNVAKSCQMNDMPTKVIKAFFC